ncbi:putative dihydroorotate oxidase [Oesophagostomum dentatum]|uniref:Dihydroorotate dehydrogenase (quinone), mitochondrial n=1 Tax=Oesophagostomum dentatum TaxID=61180 RepID=A0A0B1TK98_OESDE|nr:putative dihydroorotate oxidase [Oesophagostomum dentatum]
MQNYFKTLADFRLDYEVGASYFAPYSDYIVINTSSNNPNINPIRKKPDLIKLLKHVKTVVDSMVLESRPKVLLKIPPDLTENEKKDIAQMSMDPRHGVDALIVCDTTSSRPDTLKSENKIEGGGLSGAPIRRISTECVREMYRLTKGRVPIVGCGGVFSGADAYEKIRAGASVVQLHSALVFYGFPVVGKVKRELADLLKKDGYTNVGEAIGADHRL